MPDLELAAAGLDVLRQHLHAAHQILAVLRHGLAQQLGIGRDEIGRGKGPGDLLDVEAGLVARMGIEIVRLLDHALGPARRQQVGLLDEIEDGVSVPFGIGEAGVALLGRDHRLDLLAAEPLQRRAPQGEEVAGDRALGLDDLLGIADPALGDAAEHLDHLAGFVGLAGLGLAPFDRFQIGGRHLAGLLDQLTHILRHRLEIGHRRKLAERRFRRLWPGLALLVSWRTHDGAPLDSRTQELHSPFWTH